MVESITSGIGAACIGSVIGWVLHSDLRLPDRPVLSLKLLTIVPSVIAGPPAIAYLMSLAGSTILVLYSASWGFDVGVSAGFFAFYYLEVKRHS